ncbi:MAG: hypothetical protein Q8L53_16280 [Aestuariivirga sp.]|nr:hypothetical protein [Aestuariivirga sp.]
MRSDQPPEAKTPTSSGSRRNRLAMLLALVTAICLGSALFLTKGTQLLMPGSLTSGHAAIENCNACHTKSGSNKMSWIHGLVAADPLADSKACLTCHKMPRTAFNAHGASAEVLKQSTKRLTKIAAGSTAPRSAVAQSVAFPMKDVIAGGLYCATCHQEHQGIGFNLNKISNEQCRSCHVLKFDSFDGHHPNFENYPFERRTRIIYDHASHFGKHYPELAKKDPGKRSPATCSTCHNSDGDRRVMAAAPFDQTCTACHLGQILGKERVSGPKGIAFLTLPGLDLETLKKKNASVGEWPDASDTALTPFMKVIISRNESGRALLKAVDGLNLQDLANASDGQIKAVTNLVWEIKGLVHALIKGKASDVLGDLNVGGGAKLNAALIADLTAGIPRDAVSGAQLEWLPNLATEMANGPVTPPKELPGPDALQAIPEPIQAEAVSKATVETDTAEVNSEIESADAKLAAAKETLCAEKVALSEDAAAETIAAEAEPDGGEETPSTDEQGLAEIKGRLPLPTGTPRAIKARIEDTEAGTAEAKPEGGKETPCADEPPRINSEDQTEGAAGESDAPKAEAEGGIEAPAVEEQAADKATDQFDDLLFPTGAEKEGQPEEADDASKVEGIMPLDTLPDSNTTSADPQIQAAPVTGIEGGVDPETWAEYGGWYRQDYTIYYRPTGHKDKFIHSWLVLTGPQAPKGDTNPAAAVFDYLTSKDAQGSCTKCHSVDDVRGKARVVNFSPVSVQSKQGRFTKFIHEPHMGIMDNRGCLTCHSIEKNRPYLKSYEQGNPQKFAPSFGAVKKELCQTCHTSGKARQDCLLCHKYHVNGAAAPIMNTKIPAQ